ncbi:MAG TPA: queuosine salvage family protein [Solirubrobacterales bacterium]|nr:queuosine salvage family protein [Solirubrobacterales bacterium]
MSPVSLPDEVRVASAWVAERARSVRIDETQVEQYAVGLALGAEDEPAEQSVERDPEAAAAFAICMNAINFGSGWWPTIRKRPGLSGYSTMEAGVIERFGSAGHWSAEELAAMTTGEIAAMVGQDPQHPLMPQFAAALRDVGEHLIAQHDGRYLGAVDAAESIPDLASIFASWSSFADVSSYDGREVPFFKRAQLAAADLHRAGTADLPGFDRLTAFADNLVPHVLRVDGLLELDPELTRRIEAEELLIHGSSEEVELRACAIQAIELIAAACSVAAAEVDSALWNRGRGRRYKSLPRPRSRNSAY